ncbi:tRNA 2-selenouridine(34) synthase MnmH [Leptolyngbya sp. FACHB-261]|uniref:tRNA 2-selenouridine(34) synthase MnmH n=1 Tax=Leptolyngbya sp. FACHB-261 TaxID=2692806 RepID=UPI00168885CD|nr:tRNA 2-selenouridine(34) synthase MnmH [Leptolyngbya sp. FACHB-261]MBD2102100.1 tRNA 2-selenouridine(34) synthase MnmH [Leptolyngbya sp. FACHB-261]
MPQTLSATEFLKAPGVILDVRSPAEYAQGHILGAKAFPLFNNEERAQVGTCYKQQGREQAVELGLALVGPKLADFVSKAKALAPERQVRLHCWRGGMRSGSMAILLETAGLNVSVLTGGYKAFRGWVRTCLQVPKPLVVLGGMTGTGKTMILTALAQQGEQVLDLEHLANHRGSSYGALGLGPQPSTEHFENCLATQWAKFDPQRRVWIEAESRRVGICRLPEELFAQMEQSPILEVNRSRTERVEILLAEYGSAGTEALIAATQRIKKHLGGLRAQQAVELIRQGNPDAIHLVLDYYDKAYRYDLQRRSVPIQSVDVSGLSAEQSASCLIERANQCQF